MGCLDAQSVKRALWQSAEEEIGAESVVYFAIFRLIAVARVGTAAEMLLRAFRSLCVAHAEACSSMASFGDGYMPCR